MNADWVLGYRDAIAKSNQEGIKPMKISMSQRTLTLMQLSACLNGISMTALLIFVFEKFELFREPWGLKLYIGMGCLGASIVIDQFIKMSRRKDDSEVNAATN
jgi:hypothetical protein